MNHKENRPPPKSPLPGLTTVVSTAPIDAPSGQQPKGFGSIP